MQSTSIRVTREDTVAHRLARQISSSEVWVQIAVEALFIALAQVF